MHEDFWSALSDRLRRRPGDPLVTFVDAGSAERTELSASSFANATSKIANALADEFDLGPGSRIALAMPAHWQVATWAAGAWALGCIVTADPANAELVVASEATASSLASPAGPAQALHPVQVVSSHPFGLPIARGLPDGCEDVTVTVRNQPDAFLQVAAGPGDAALDGAEGTFTQAEVLAHARELGARWQLTSGGRLHVPARLEGSEALMACLAVPLACDAAAVIVRALDSDDEARLAGQERITAWAAPSR